MMEMCLTEYNEKEERELLRQEALEIGREEGRTIEAKRMDRLVSELLDQNRVEDLKKATLDPAFKEMLFREFNL
ncbi:MAG: hypothetical protein IKS77_04440 [Spirochaetales bacterium]|nr:hypothetical protein [Spirochaetales bacterium]